MSADQKLLTLVVTGRNDAYQGNFLYRISSCLNFAAQQLDRIQRLENTEILITDWGSEVPLADALPLTWEARQICRFVFVPSDIARQARPDGDFFPSCAINTSIRRALGRFIILFDADSLFPAYSFRVLFDLIERQLDLKMDVRRVFYFLNRHHIPWEASQHHFTVEEWERYLLLNTGNLQKDRSGFGLGSAGSGQMMHRDLWRELRGYNESLIGQGWIDVEIALRATQIVPLLDLAGIGLHLFHMEHWPHNRRQPYVNKIFNPFRVSQDVCVNGSDWGLGNHKLEMMRARRRPSIALSKRQTPPNVPFPPLNSGELIQQINSDEVRRHVAKYFELTARFEQIEASYKLDEPSSDIEALFILSWYALQHPPRALLDYGVSSGHQLGVIAMACWNVEIYGARPWIESESKEMPPLARLDHILNITGYRGYARHVTGNPDTALQRLFASRISSAPLDLVIFDDRLSPSTTLSQIERIIPHLAPDALLLLQSETPDRLEHLLSGLSLKCPCLASVACGSDRNAMLFHKKSVLAFDAPREILNQNLRPAPPPSADWNQPLVAAHEPSSIEFG